MILCIAYFGSLMSAVGLGLFKQLYNLIGNFGSHYDNVDKVRIKSIVLKKIPDILVHLFRCHLRHLFTFSVWSPLALIITLVVSGFL